MKILILTSTFLPTVGGGEIAVHNLAEGLVDLGHEVLVCAEANKNARRHRHRYVLWRYPVPRGLYRTGLVDWWISLCLIRMARKWRPDLIEAHFIWPSGYGAILAKSVLRLPVVITCQGADIQSQPEINYGMRLNPRIDAKVREAGRRANCLIAISSDIHQEFLKLGALPVQLADIPNSINFEWLVTPDNFAKDKLNISNDRPVLLAVGRNHPKKRFIDLIKAMALLSPIYPKALAVLVGKGVSQLSALVKELQLENHVRLYEQTLPLGIDFENGPASPTDYIGTFYKAADIYVMPSSVEGLPVAGVEAMACGLPLVASHAPGAEDLIIEGANGLLYPVGDTGALAGILGELLEKTEYRRQLGAKAQEMARVYDRRVVAEQHLRIYEQLLAVKKNA